MVKRIRTPQEKKVRDYLHQRTNAYGESDKGSRRSIRNRKRWINRAYRKGVNDAVKRAEADPESVYVAVSRVKRHSWRKCPDIVLLEEMQIKWSGSSREKAKPKPSKLRSEAKKRFTKSNARKHLPKIVQLVLGQEPPV